MKRFGMWMASFFLSVFVLSVPILAGAALTPESQTGYGGANWLRTIDDPSEWSGDTNKGFDIIHAYQGYSGSNYYFLVEMQSGINKNHFADSYVLHVGSLTFTAYLSFSGNDPVWSHSPSLPSGAAFESDGKFLEWKLSAATIGSNSTWWIETYDGATLVDTTAHASVATPIPNAAWLLGTGLIGLIGLKRRRAVKA